MFSSRFSFSFFHSTIDINHLPSATLQIQEIFTMRFSIASIALLVVAAVSVSAAPQTVPFGICSCFKPDFDASCCIPGKGYMENDGNVCATVDAKDSMQKYVDCCHRSGGTSKCKTGYRDPKNWPPADSYGCKA